MAISSIARCILILFALEGLLGQDEAPPHGVPDEGKHSGADPQDSLDAGQEDSPKDGNGHLRRLQVWGPFVDETLAISMTSATTATFTISQLDDSNDVTRNATTYGVRLTPDLMTGETLFCSMACASPAGANDYGLIAYHYLTGELYYSIFSATCPLGGVDTSTSTAPIFLLALANTTSANGLVDASISCQLIPTPTPVPTPVPTPKPTISPAPTPDPTLATPSPTQAPQVLVTVNPAIVAIPATPAPTVAPPPCPVVASVWGRTKLYFLDMANRLRRGIHLRLRRRQ